MSTLTSLVRHTSTENLLERLEWSKVFRAASSHEADELAERLRLRGLGVCRECYCTDVTACDPPCSWVELDLCSGCAE